MYFWGIEWVLYKEVLEGRDGRTVIVLYLFDGRNGVSFSKVVFIVVIRLFLF